ncbi:MAG: molybdopterin converting factor subunit 1 [Hydrogenophilales bacterium 16-64-46]|nr:MAG: molybdopterin converting factor subunit 1 [Hydrogenophilales bacterium 12-64-13]OYZ05677.1 MAG: molybdopterin converting factor subunit 1 [Hydrogenophilales bacterium 16-64-46]OZA40256.1 MAG: molybdopterin converting factor subunit 1 [Hydrogenophilales bacterium 17-64-34]HQT00807.1 molybdopterin converting factor subunit 1 [Thiobacillus sp.]
MRLRILYFARMRERFGVGEESLAFDGATVADLLEVLRARGGVWAEELAPGRSFRVALNQHLVTPDVPLTDAAEVAIFPPVTGG